MRASASDAEIARILGIRHHVVRRAIGIFLERGIFIQRSAFVDPFVLGLHHETTLISLPSESQRHYGKLRELLANSEESVAVIEHGGPSQLEVRTYTRGPAHLQAFFEDLAKKFPHPFRITGTLTILEQEYSGVWEPGSQPKMEGSMGYAAIGAQRQQVQLDEVDHSILSALCNAKYLNWKQLAQHLSMPVSTLSYRIAALEKARVIQGHYYVVDVKVFHDLPILLHVSGKVMTERERFELKKFCRLHPKVAWMSVFFGAQAAEMLVRVQSYDEARTIMAEASQHLAGVADSLHMTAPIKFFKWSDYPFKRHETLTGR